MAFVHFAEKTNAMKPCIKFLLSAAALLSPSCEFLDKPSAPSQEVSPRPVSLQEVASIFASIPIGMEQIEEVYDAVSASVSNGYDEEYTLGDLFASPGAGVGDRAVRSSVSKAGRTAGAKSYRKPLRDLIKEHLTATKSSLDYASDPEEYITALTSSDIQIYWPYSEKWNSSQYPIITYDPSDGSDTNIGYKLSRKEDGTLGVEEVIVDEELAKTSPVWVVNRNNDGGYSSLEMLRKTDPSWGSGGGDIIVGTKAAQEGTIKTLLLKTFTANRNYDSWLAGGSEFFVKCGSVENFTATTENEMLMYNPSVTDFMIVVKRSEIGVKRPFNAILVSSWTGQLENCAFMITEDDGGTVTNWKCAAEVKIKSKSYGFDISIPFNSRDDIVWRGQLSGAYFEKYSGQTGHFGDVDLTFEVL